MDISDVRVKLIQDSSDRLKAVCTVTFDECFVVRDVKVVEGTNGLFVAMPSRKVAAHCPNCRQKNQLRATYCNFCGKKLPPPRPQPEGDGRSRMHKDLAHPITAEFREIVQTKVIAAYETELEQAPEPTNDRPRPPRERQDREDARPVRAPESEPTEKMQELEPLEISEYDALIADLKKSSGSANHRGDKAETARPRDDRKERPREREPQKREEPEVQSEQPEQRDEPVRPAPRVERPPVEKVEEAPTRAPIEPARSTAVSEPEVVAAEADDDDGDGFGEGIL